MRIGAILITSADGAALARFYRDRLSLPIEEERHGSRLHWGCMVGEVHFAIHPSASGATANTAVAFAFSVDDVDALVTTLRTQGVRIEMEPQDRPFGRLAGVRDPDGNLVYLHRYPERG